MYILMVFLPALLVVFIARFLYPHDITLKEMGLHFLGAILGTALCFGLMAASSAFSSWDYEIRNGYITKKYSKRVSCEHQYKCGETCSTDGKGNRTCIPIYCDEHSYDMDWRVDTTINSFKIDRVSRQGLKEPPRFTAVKIGEPVADTFSTRNYLLLDKTRFSTTEAVRKQYANSLPQYPEVFDYHRINRVVNSTDQSFNYINVWLNDKLRVDAAEKQMNIIVVVTYFPESYYQAVYESWNGGKKNDILLFYGIDKDRNIKWFRANTFAEGQDNQSMLHKLKVSALDTKIGMDLVQEQYRIIYKNFKRLPNETFSYMDNIFDPSVTALVLSMIFNFFISIGLAYFFKKEHVA